MKKTTALLVSLVLLLTVSVGATLAFLIDQTDPLPNTFAPSKVTTSVVETLDGQIKKDVQIKNTGDTTAYIRAAVIVTWQNAAGEVYGAAPTSNEYTITWSGTEENGGWIKIGDFYYHEAPVAADGLTSVLFTNCAVAEGANVPDGYYLNVEILGSGIQSVPVTVVETEWGVTVENGVITNAG